VDRPADLLASNSLAGKRVNLASGAICQGQPDWFSRPKSLPLRAPRHCVQHGTPSMRHVDPRYHTSNEVKSGAWRDYRIPRSE
jgi:hypothetical protein